MVIFIDESGTLPDKADKYIVIAALVALNPQELEKILQKFRKKIPSKGLRKKEKQTKELKFHYVGEITRKKVLKEIISKNVRIYILVIDKMGRKISDNPVNYGKLVRALIIPILVKEKPKEICIDKHFSTKVDVQRFQSILESIDDQVTFRQVDSITDSRIDLADFIAGATLRKLRVGDESFYEIISAKIVWERVKKWNIL